MKWGEVNEVSADFHLLLGAKRLSLCVNVYTRKHVQLQGTWIGTVGLLLLLAQALHTTQGKDKEAETAG